MRGAVGNWDSSDAEMGRCHLYGLPGPAAGGRVESQWLSEAELTEMHEGSDDQGARAEIVNRLLADGPQEATYISKWLRVHEADVVALYHVERSIKGVAATLGLTYPTVAAWFRLEVGTPSSARLSGPSATPADYNARIGPKAMAEREKPEPEHEPDVDPSQYVPSHQNNGVPNGLQDGDYLPMEPGEVIEASKPCPSVPADDFAMMMYWKGKYEALAEALPVFLKAAWEAPE